VALKNIAGLWAPVLMPRSRCYVWSLIKFIGIGGTAEKKAASAKESLIGSCGIFKVIERGAQTLKKSYFEISSRK